MNKERAAQIWSVLERALIERCGLGDGRMLEVNRPYLIRVIGDALTITPVDTAIPHNGITPDSPVRARVHGVVDKAALKATLDMAVANLPAEWVRSSAEVRAIRDEMMLNKRIDEVLDAMLDKACSRRVGYDGDDSVGYE